MAYSLSLAPLCQPRLLAGQEHGWTIPLSETDRYDHLPEAGASMKRQAFLRILGWAVLHI